MSSSPAGSDLRREAWTLCKDYLGGAWKELPLDRFAIQQLSGGLSNTLYRCHLPDDVTEGRGGPVPKEVLLRFYGPLQEDPNAVIREAVTFVLLSERKLGPRLHGIFATGRIEEFIPSHPLTTAEVRSYGPLIARELARIHALRVPLRKAPDIWKNWLSTWLEEVQQYLVKDGDATYMSSDDYKKEIDWLADEMEKQDSPVVYCHNDLQGGNILRREEAASNGKPELMLIDFEFGGYNYRGFDLANHFLEWCFEYETPEFPHFVLNRNKFPTQEQQAEYITAYLDQLIKEGVTLQRPLEEEKNKIMGEIPVFACASNLMWSLWSVKMAKYLVKGFSHKVRAENGGVGEESSEVVQGKPPSQALHGSTLARAFQEHGKTRRVLYREYKEKYLASQRASK